MPAIRDGLPDSVRVAYSGWLSVESRRLKERS